MATTRLMPLHTGKGRTVGQAISDIIDYTENPQKTDGGRLITSWQCDSRIADAEVFFTKNQYIQKTGRVRGEDDVIAYHLRQSFVPGEITPEEAIRLGCELVKRFTKGNHAYIVCTHIDKAHIHNHVIWNSTALSQTRKFRNFWGSSRAVRRLNDTICIENGYSIVENERRQPVQNLPLGGCALRHFRVSDRRSAGICLLHLRRCGADRHLAAGGSPRCGHSAAVSVAACLAATAIPLHAISRMSIADSIETGLKQKNSIPLDKSRPARYNNATLYITQRYYTRMVLMPAVRKVSKEQIIDAAVEVLRDDGFAAINARSVAKKLGCSTQPIYFSFKNMDELKAALTQRAIELHTQRVRDSLCAHEGNDSRYSSYGMGFVKFAAEEKQLFRWLYLEGEQPGTYQSDILTQEVIGVIVDEFGYAEDVARRFHQDMIYFTYGLAILANTDHLYLTETELREAFRREFRALISIYGKPAKLPEFAMKAGVVL